MSLQVWLPLTGDLHNQGLSGEIPSLMGNGITYTDGKIGLAATFPNSCNSCIYMTGLKLQTGTWAAWINVLGEGAGTSQRIISEGRDTGSVGTNIWVNKAGTSLTVHTHKKALATTINLNEWVHIVLSFGEGIIKLYKNGQMISSTTYTEDTDYAQSNDKLVLGKMSYSYTSTSNYFPFNGQLNDVRIYDHVLSDKEVEEIAKGLVLHYKLDNNGLGGENLALNTKTLDVASSKNNLNMYIRGASTRQLRSDGFYESRGTASWQGLSFWANQLNLTVGTKVTYSFYIYGNGSSRAFSFYPMMYNSAGSRDTSTKLPISIDGGSYTTVNSKPFENTTATAPEYHYVTFEWNQAVADIISNGGSIELSIQVHGTWNNGDWACIFAPKVELGDKPTPWSPNPIDLGLSSNIVYDSSGYQNNGTINDIISADSNTVRYNASTLFNGTSSSITIPYKAVNPDGVFTMNLWFYKDALGSENYETLFGGPSGFEMDTRSGGSTTLSLYMASTRGGNIFSPFSLNTWYMVTMVRDGVNEKYYINGELKKTIEAKSMPNGTYFIGAWSNASGQNYYGNISDFRLYCTPLTDAQILELYHTSATIDNNGNVYARELVEE